MNNRDFVTTFGGIYEHSSWVAERVSQTLDSQKSLVEQFKRVVDTASDDQKLALLCAHPDLAGKAAIAGTLTAESSLEQSAAGIDQCSQTEYEAFTTLNKAYKKKFNFPFIMAVRDSNRQMILSAFQERLENDRQTEYELALKEVHKIAAFRFADLKNTQ